MAGHGFYFTGTTQRHWLKINEVQLVHSRSWCFK